MIITNCLVCNKEFECQRKSRKYCSQKCMSKDYYNRTYEKIEIKPKDCEYCGVEFNPKKSYSRFCSKKCRNLCSRKRNKGYGSKRRNELRQRIFEMYGRSCECCGENNEEFLTVDHINGDGKEHRELRGSGGLSLFYDFIKEYRPDKYRILCMNCNWCIGSRGYCPHQTKKEVEEVGYVFAS